MQTKPLDLETLAPMTWSPGFGEDYVASHLSLSDTRDNNAVPLLRLILKSTVMQVAKQQKPLGGPALGRAVL